MFGSVGCGWLLRNAVAMFLSTSSPVQESGKNVEVPPLPPLGFQIGGGPASKNSGSAW